MDRTELAKPAVPAWFTHALAAPVQTGQIQVAGAAIRYRMWGSDNCGLVLVHGGAANARWWDHIAPLLTEHRRVIAVDLSGHGVSDRREKYGLDIWAREVMAVIAATGIENAPVVIGHSLGGFAPAYWPALNWRASWRSIRRSATSRPRSRPPASVGPSGRCGSIRAPRPYWPAFARCPRTAIRCPTSRPISPSSPSGPSRAAGAGSSTRACSGGYRSTPMTWMASPAE